MNVKWWSFGLAVLVTLGYIVFYGFFFERYIVFLESLFSGAISGIPLFDFQNIAYVGLALVFSKLYQLVPDFYWLDASHILVALVTALLFFFGVAMLAQKRGVGLVAALLLSGNVAALTYFNLVSSNNCREILLFTSMMLLVFWGWQKHKPWWKFVLAWVGMVLIALLRFEFAAFAAVVFCCFAATQPGWLKVQWKWFLAPLAFFVVVGAYLFYDRNYSGDFAKESDFSQYLIADADHLALFESFSDPKDSLRYMAAKELWLSDTANLKIDFFRSLQQYKVGFSVNYFQNYFPFYLKRAIEMLAYFVSDNLAFVLLPLLLLIYFLAQAIWVTADVRQRWPVLLLPFTAIVFLLLLLCYLVRMETTVFQPLMLVSVLYLLATKNQTPPPAQRTQRDARLKVVLAGLLFVNLIVANKQLYSFANQRSRLLQNNMAACREADSLAAGKYLLLDGYSNLIYDHRPGNNFVFKQPKNILLYDCGQLILAEPFLSYHASICQCNPLDNMAFYSFLLTNKKDVLLLSNPQRMAFVMGYLRGMHGLPIGYRKMEGGFEAEKLTDFGMELHYYTLTDNPQDNG